MKTITKDTIPSNTGRTYIVKKGQHIRVSGTTIVDFVPFAYPNVRERFDQSRTKAFHRRIFISTGDYLVSKFNNPMLKIIEDTYNEGTHDLERGTCNARRWRMLEAQGPEALKPYAHRNLTKLPDHGCWENLTEALKPYGVAAEDIPSPFNIFMTLDIDGKTGAMRDTTIRPKETAHVDMVAEMDCLIAISACPDMQVGGKDVDILVYEARE
jgi:uncharacterized protein YcgI (DUF1989 family)